MRYRIVGEDMESGLSIELRVDVDNEANARRIARGYKLAVRTVEPVSEAPPAQHVPVVIEPPADAAGGTKYRVVASHPSSGAQVTLIVAGHTPSAAEANARAMGYEVLSLTLDPSEVQASPPATIGKHADVPGVVTIQKTSKRWKKGMLIGLAMFVGGIVAMVVIPAMLRDQAERYQEVATISVIGGLVALLSMIGGVCVVIYCRIAAWWHHG